MPTVTRDPSLLPEEAIFGLRARRVGPIGAEEFEGWVQDEDNPVELLEGWVVPMSPGTFDAGEVLLELTALLSPLAKAKGWRMSTDARHRLPRPKATVIFPDVAIHATRKVPLAPGSKTVSRVPDLVIEILSPETHERDVAPHGAKFLAYQLSGVREYYYARPDGTGAAGFRLEGGVFVPLAASEGFFSSPLLGSDLRLAPAGVRQT